MKKRLLSGIQPSGQLHLGNYLGAIKQHLESQENPNVDRFYFIANYHSLTSISDPTVLHGLTFDVARTYLAMGLDPNKTLLFVQSDVPEVCELTWILSTITPMGLLQRCTSYKDKVAQGIASSHGLFAYPVLQASDILIYDSHLVPVGMDQKQHIEVCRDQPKFAIDLFGSKKKIKSQVMSIVTDSMNLEDPKDPETCNVFALYRHFASDEELQDMADRYRKGGYGYGHAKLELLKRIEALMELHRESYDYYGNHPDEVWDILHACGVKARTVARETLDRVRNAVGLG